MKNFTLASRARRGFTLVEILVVIAIIGILSAIMFPVLSRAREGARRTSCASNLKQLGMAFAQYQQDNKRYPLGGNFQAWAPGSAHWVAGVAGEGQELVSIDLNSPPPLPKPEFKKAADVEHGALFSYVKEKSVYYCPSAALGRETGLSYGMNCAVAGLSDTRIRQPAEIILLVDEAYATDGWFWASDTKTGTATAAAGCSGVGCSTDALLQKHNGGGNLLFTDGHVKFFPFNTFQLDHSPQGLANKARMTENPRFHDRAFGSIAGSSLVPFENAAGTFNTNVDACLRSKTAAPPTTPPTA